MCRAHPAVYSIVNVASHLEAESYQQAHSLQYKQILAFYATKTFCGYLSLIWNKDGGGVVTKMKYM